MKKLIAVLLATVTLVCAIPFSSNAVTDTLPFTDVKSDYWFYEAVKYTYEEGIFKGTDAEGKIFSPAKNMTRAELVMTLFQLTGADKASYAGDTGFVDVSAKSWMAYAVKWASEKGYVSGVGNNKFNPQGLVTRQEFAAILYRFAKDYYLTDGVDASILAAFPDTDKVASWATTAMEWATDRKIINGVAVKDGDPEVSPTGKSTRAQAAQMLMTFIKMFDGQSADGVVDKDLVFAVRNTVFTEPKNIIYMISDGTGFNILEATENIYHDSLYMDKLAMNYIPQRSHQTTYSTNNHVTDSAAGATALSTGHKTSNSTVAMDETDTIPFTTVLEMAAEKGMSTGVVVTKTVTDATPAAFTAHSSQRGNTDDIANQQTEKLISGELDVLMGGGNMYFDDAYCIESGINYTTVKSGLEDAQMPFLGLFDYDNMDTHDETLPTLPEMTAKALELLSADENGFFLMVEGSQVDTYNHDNQLENAAREAYDFDRCVALALEFAVANPDTMIIITADHETGGLYIPAEPTPENIVEGSRYSSTGHTERSVPLYALGYGVEELTGIVENTDIAIFIASVLGYDNVGTKSTVHTLVDESKYEVIAEANSMETSDGVIKAVFNKDNRDLTIPCELVSDTMADIKNARVVHIEITNTGDTVVQTPLLTVDLDGDYVDAIPQHEYLEAGQSCIISYILHSYLWSDDVFNTATELSFGYGADIDAEFDIGNIYVTDRVLDR